MSSLANAVSPFVDDGSIPGLVAAVEHGSELEVVVRGGTGPGGPPLRRDSLFRIASISKPITAVAAMTLVEDGTIRLDEPVDRLLPELADRRVLRSETAELDDTVPAARPITVEDLLTFRSGLGVPPLAPGTLPWQRAYAEARLGGDGPPGSHPVPPPDEWARRLGALPLLAPPGERWLYHTGSDALGVLLGRAAGTSLGALLTERVLGPLGMVDTGFAVPARERHRFQPEWWGGRVFDPVDGQWARPPEFESGGGGLVSTLDDLLAFARMLRRGGDPVLRPETVAAMTYDRLTEEQRAGAGIFLDGSGWGLGMAVEADGRYGWDGGLGTSWRNDPARDLTGILLTQVMWPDPAGSAVTHAFWKAVG
ncbi:beta-lactamase family protein [Pseudonocardia kujensis]|uniref:serine hydrolase domain-containing protein n=1 Tax=Pseudonocardia kujensis TaxID=1128675 RepID=UPI001E39BF13|nr:serine hydrolase domain-containing protein [Pseudonocardia kujensis]MCE0767670.1 beta-lactamase family protein [Pseudonocardia kujensis]